MAAMKLVVHRETVPLMSSGVGVELAFQLYSVAISSLTVLMKVMKTSVVSQKSYALFINEGNFFAVSTDQ